MQWASQKWQNRNVSFKDDNEWSTIPEKSDSRALDKTYEKVGPYSGTGKKNIKLVENRDGIGDEKMKAEKDYIWEVPLFCITYHVVIFAKMILGDFKIWEKWKKKNSLECGV